MRTYIFLALFAALIAWVFAMDITKVDMSIMAGIVAEIFLVSVSYDVKCSDLRSAFTKDNN